MAWGNKVIFLLAFGLLIFGLVMVYDASSASAVATFKDKYFFVREQIKWVLVGAAIGTGAFLFDYRKLRFLALPFLLATIFLLVLVFVPGIGTRAYGASRWINLGFTVLQPSELAKLTFVIYLSAWLTNREKGRLLPFLLLTGLLVGLVIMEPDMGTAVVLFGTAVTVYFLSESSIVGLVLLIPVFILGGLGIALASPYRVRRVLSFLNPDLDPLGASYHVRQALIALGSGGLFGLGLGNSRQKYSYLPEATTDSIFAIISEELGFIGAVVVILVFGLFFYWAAKAVILVEEPFGRLLGMGIIAYLAIQTLVNILSMVALVPLTGVPLPFISYGGSALVVEMAGLGILGSILRSK